MITNTNIKRFNKFYTPNELPGQLNVARNGTVMCAAVVTNPWWGGYWDWEYYKSWLQNECTIGAGV